MHSTRFKEIERFVFQDCEKNIKSLTIFSWECFLSIKPYLKCAAQRCPSGQQIQLKNEFQ